MGLLVNSQCHLVAIWDCYDDHFLPYGARIVWRYFVKN